MEYWDIYDENKKLTGRQMVRNDWNMKPGDYHLTVLGVLKRKSDGRFLITQRVDTKSWAPGWWEVTGGGVLSGETSEQAVKREIKEETGIDVSGLEGGYVFSYRRDNPEEKDNYFVDIYLFEGEIKDEDIKLQEKEAKGYAFADADEIRSIGEKGRFLHYDSIRRIFIGGGDGD